MADVDASAAPGGPDAARAERLAFMRRHPLFEGLSDADLAQLESLSGTRELEAGTVLLHEGEAGDEMFIVVDGELEVRRAHQGGGHAVLGTRGSGEVLGEMALLGGEVRSASAVALTDARLLRIDRAALDALFQCSTAAPLTIVATVLRRLRSAEAMLVQQEKLASLGTMAAGLAHELNNPASAIVRAARHFDDAWRAWRDACQALLVEPLDAGQARLLGELTEAAGRDAARPPSGGPLGAADREAQVRAYLAEHGVEAPWDLAAPFAQVGWDAQVMARQLAAFEVGQRALVARYLAAALEVHALVRETETGAAAISEIVRSVKSYAYLDEAPVQNVDVRQGLEDTLVILRHRLDGGVRVVRDYADDLPRIEARGSELNQVWTNLIGNALDALDGRGTLRVRAEPNGAEVRVTICDDGPGIPAEIQNRIFDPFFTTKDVGIGNGLGLHLVHGIVRGHRGRVTLASRPGETCFEVCLPVEGPRSAGS